VNTKQYKLRSDRIKPGEQSPNTSNTEARIDYTQMNKASRKEHSCPTSPKKEPHSKQPSSSQITAWKVKLDKNNKRTKVERVNKPNQETSILKKQNKKVGKGLKVSRRKKETTRIRSIPMNRAENPKQVKRENKKSSNKKIARRTRLHMRSPLGSLQQRTPYSLLRPWDHNLYPL